MYEIFSHPVPAVVVLLGVLVFFHELGHFIVGRMCGIAVEIFSIGFGPKIFGFKRGHTEYCVSWIPLGGFVKFYGALPTEEVPLSVRGSEFYRASLAKRVATVAAGPLANFILAAVAYCVLGHVGISHPPALIGEVLSASPAEAAGLQPGDLVTAIDDHAVKTWGDIERTVAESAGKNLSFHVLRNGQSALIHVVPATLETTDNLGRKVTIGRAGVARGHLPSIVAVADLKSVAALAGFKSGDRVRSVDFLGNHFEVENFPQFAVRMRDAYAQGAKEVSLSVIDAPVPRLELSDDLLQRSTPASQAKSDIDSRREASIDQPGQVRTIVLPLASLSSASLSADPKWPENAQNLIQWTPTHMRALVGSLGILDAQVTIGAVDDIAKGVLEVGDTFLTLGGKPVQTVFQIGEVLRDNQVEKLSAEVSRKGERVALTLPLKGIETQAPAGKITIYLLPLAFWAQASEPAPVIEKYDSLVDAARFGCVETARQTAMLFITLKHLLSGDVPLKALGGPIMIAKVAGDAAKLGWQVFLNSMALISVNLGLINLFPIPVLDGGQLVLFFLEALRRKPLGERAIENFQKVGFVMVMALAVLATYNDFSRFWKNMLQSVVGFFQ